MGTEMSWADVILDKAALLRSLTERTASGAVFMARAGQEPACGHCSRHCNSGIALAYDCAVEAEAVLPACPRQGHWMALNERMYGPCAD